MSNEYNWTLINQKKHVAIQPVKLSLFQQCHVVECEETMSKDRFLLFFYKNEFLTALPLKEFESTSFLAQVRKYGIHLEAPSPLFSFLMHPTASVQAIPLTQLFRQLKRTYSPTESALICSYFDAYFNADQLDSIVREPFLTYRRNGQFSAAYRLAVILINRGYNPEWAQTATKQLEYEASSALYAKDLSSLLDDDPLFVEQRCFPSYEEKEHASLLATIYAKQANPLNSILIKLITWKLNPTKQEYDELIDTLSVHLTEEDTYLCLTPFLDIVKGSSGLHEDVYTRLIHKEKYQQGIQLLLTHSFPLSHTAKKQLPVILGHFSFHELSIPLKDTFKRLFGLLAGEQQALERLIKENLPLLFQSYSLLDVHTWFHEHQAIRHLSVKRKIDEMVLLLDEPDKQMTLGEHYYEFRQYELAIECFSWEMELHPDEAKPVQWLAKTYQKWGKPAEAKMYQQLLSQVQKPS